MKKLTFRWVTILILAAILLPAATTIEGNAQTFSCADVSEIPQIECEALVAIYNNTGGAYWINNTNWLVTNTPSGWYGVTVTAGQVTQIDLSENNLAGSIPPEIGTLTALEFLGLSYNQLTGSIPPEIGDLTALEYLDLSYNQLTGSIPPALGNLTTLSSLHLSRNQLTGSIPPALGNLTALQVLHLWYNQLTGSIPPELGNLTALQVLILQSNQLTGNIPLELGNLTALQGLILSNNQLTGSIPPELGNLTNLQALDLNNNHLSGTIPTDLGNLTNLQYLVLSANQLTGPITLEITQLSTLSTLMVEGNRLSGDIPTSLGTMTNLVVLGLSGNQFTGTIPADLGNLINLQVLRLSYNQLTGTIPEEIGSILSLNSLWLGGNYLEGDIPASLANLVNIYDPDEYTVGLHLDYNSLNVPDGYPDPTNPLHLFLQQKDPDWHLYQGFSQDVGVAGGTITSLDNRTTITIPAGALDETLTFTFVPRETPNHPVEPLLFANNSFQLSAADPLGDPVTSFNLPITVTLTYSDTDLFGIYEAVLGMYYWNEDLQEWADAAGTCSPGSEYIRDLDNNTLSLAICHLSEFALLGEPKARIFLPFLSR